MAVTNGEMVLQASQEYIFFPADSIVYPLISSTAILAVLASFYFTKASMKNPLNKMVIAINLADLVFVLTKASASVIEPINDVHCKFLQVSAQSGIISSVFWGAFFGHALYIVAKYYQGDQIAKYMINYVIFGVFVPIGLSFGSIFTDYVVYSATNGGVCVHRLAAGQVDYDSLIFTIIPIGIGCVLSVMWYFMAFLRIKNLVREGDKANLMMLMVYPGIMLLCWTPILIVSTRTFFGLNSNHTFVSIARALDQLQGLFDAIVYSGLITTLKRGYNRTCNKRQNAERELTSSELSADPIVSSIETQRTNTRTNTLENFKERTLTAP